MNTIGNKIRILRDERGFSQETIGMDLGLTQTSYARLEKKDERISIIRLIEIAKILNTTVSELIDEKTQKISHQNNNDTANSYNADTIHNIINADKDHIASLKEEIQFLKSLVEQKQNIPQL